MPDLVTEAKALAKQSPANELTIDTLVEIFALTMGSYKGASGMVLWCWVNYSSMSFDLFHQANITYCFVMWLLMLTLFKLLSYCNHQFVNEWGRSQWTLESGNDEIVITGGSSGLGLILTALFSAHNFRVHNIDVSKPALDVANTTFHKCEIGNYQEVFEVVSRRIMKPSVLINCAGTTAGVLGDFSKLDPECIANVVTTNTLGPMYVTQAMLKCHRNSFKMVVGISSSTALCGPAFAGVYASSKAAVRIFYESLRHELRPNVRVLWVTPGQLDTRMFENIATPSRFLSPVASSADVAASIVKAVLRGQQGEMSLPFYTKVLPYVLCLPQSLVDIMRRIIGIDAAAKPGHIANPKR